MNRVEVPVDPTSGRLMCQHECKYSDQCPNHIDADMHTFIEGNTPIVHLWPDNKLYCRQELDKSSFGALSTDIDMKSLLKITFTLRG